MFSQSELQVMTNALEDYRKKVQRVRDTTKSDAAGERAMIRLDLIDSADNKICRQILEMAGIKVQS